MERNPFENPALYSQYLTYSGNRVNESGVTMSVTITEMKLKKTIKQMSLDDMNEIVKPSKPLIEIGADRHRNDLLDKIETLKEWQLFKALRIQMEIGRIEAVEFIFRSKKTDKEINHIKKLNK